MGTSSRDLRASTRVEKVQYLEKADTAGSCDLDRAGVWASSSLVVSQSTRPLANRITTAAPRPDIGGEQMPKSTIVM